MTHEQILQALKDWLADNKGNAGITVVEANQNAPRPALPYITLYVTSTPLNEHANQSAPNSAGTASIENEAAVMASVQCFGENSKSIMDGLRLSLEKVTVRQALRAAGLPYIRTLNGVNDLTEVVGTKYEPRAGMDLEFRAVMAVTDSVGVIESVEGTATHDTGKNNNLTINYEIGAET